jgi:hypothetical protein
LDWEDVEDEADAADVDRATEDAAAQTARAIAAIALRPEQFFGFWESLQNQSLHVSSEVTGQCQSYRSRIGRAAVALEPHSFPAPPHVVVHSERR